MKSLAMLFLSITLLAGFSAQAKAEIVPQESIQAHVKIDYRVGIFYYVPVIDKDFKLELGKPLEIDVKFKNTTRTTKLIITINEINNYNRTLAIQIARKDYRGNTVLGTPNTMRFTHELNRGSSVISIRGQDPETSGPFRIKLDF